MNELQEVKSRLLTEAKEKSDILEKALFSGGINIKVHLISINLTAIRLAIKLPRDKKYAAYLKESFQSEKIKALLINAFQREPFMDMDGRYFWFSFSREKGK
jgi:hypothetical protein